MNNSERKWTTRNGEILAIKDMTTEHIKNTIKAIEDERIVFQINLGYFEDNDFQVIDEDTFTKNEWLKAFREELKKRGIDND